MFQPVFTLNEISRYLGIPIDQMQRDVTSGRLQALNTEVPALANKPAANMQANIHLNLKPAVLFKHKWPDTSVEAFSNAHEGTVLHSGRNYAVKIGFTIRTAAGKPRVRVLVLIDRYPTVEFVGEDAEIGGKGLVASVIKERSRKHVPAGANVPTEYVGFPIGEYREIVDGPGASNAMAVICKQDDLETMIKHALIRYEYSESRIEKK